MEHIPQHLLQKMPPDVVQKLVQHQQEFQKQSGKVNKDMLDKILQQWKPGWSILNYLFVELPPRQPFTVELTNYPSRSKYYETFICTWTFCFSILLFRCLNYSMCRWKLGGYLKNERLASALQFLLIVVPFQISVLDYPIKKYANFVLPFNAACICAYLACLLHQRVTNDSNAAGKSAGSSLLIDVEAAKLQAPSASLEANNKKPPFNNLLSIYRSIVYISTAVCIFSRDQPCWNNDFSKTYSFGTGLMDVGIGCFIVCIGSLGPTALRNFDSVDRSLALRKAALQAGILTVCGIVKTLLVSGLAAIRGVHFDESWREYGVHWNAFYSLAVARLLGAALELLALPRRMPPLMAAVMVAAAHEVALWLGLAQVVLAPGFPEPHNRSNLIGQNREGLASVPGLIALYLAGLQLGRWTRDWNGGRSGASVKILGLLIASLAWRPLTIPRDGGGYVLPESRRLMNPSYCAWVLAFSCYCILSVCLCLVAQRKLHLPSCEDEDDTQTPLHLRQVDVNGLPYFLVSNLLTGGFNFLLDRVYSDRESSDGFVCFAVILVYMVAAFYFTQLAASRLSFRLLQEKLMRKFWPS